MQTSSRFANNFDLIRLVAAVFVLITHSYTVLTIEPRDLLYVLTNKHVTLSAIGVRIFFVLSGFLIAQSFLKSSGFVEYFWKRCLRIFPGLFIVIVLTVFFLGPMVSQLSVSEYFSHRHELKEYLLGIFIYPIIYELPGVFTENNESTVNASLWTIPYEFTYYVLIAFILFLASLAGKFMKAALLLLWLGLISFNIFFYGMGYHNFPIPHLNLSFNFALDFFLYFLGGTLCYVYSEQIRYHLAGFILISGAWVAFYFIYPTFNLLILSYLFLPYAVFYLAFLRGPSNHFGKFGDFSYGFYLYAFPVQQSLLHFYPDIGVIEMMTSAFIITMIFAWLSWHLVEKKALRLKNIFRLPAKQPTISASSLGSKKISDS